MWTSRSLIALVLLASATPSRAGLFGNSNDGSLVNQGIGFLRNMGVLPSDKVDSDFILERYNEALENLRKSKWSCVRGLTHEVTTTGESMKMWNGELKDLNGDPLGESTRIRVEVNDLKDNTDAEVVTAEVGFKFPETILVSDFTYSGTMWGYGYTRDGTVKLKVGPDTVRFPVKLPMSKTAISNEPDPNKCYFKISQTGIKSEAADNFEVKDVIYVSKTKISYAKTAMTAMFTKLKEDVQMNVFASLERHVANMIKKIGFSCLEPAAQEKWKPLKREVDCNDVRKATKYNPDG